uniref:Uncharacterized protein n=1 Tax=Timema poppense TaxID=170557 RepID=A0A7R9DWJ0_TIMPO|nr:unnamed protein product [Timema poppensis]
MELSTYFEWVQHKTEVNIEPQAGPSVQMDPTPTFQAKDPAESPGNSHPSSSRKRKRHTDGEELESSVKLFQGIQQDHNSIKEMANAINRLASAQEKLLVQQQTSATILETAVAAQLESNRLQQAHNIKMSELFVAFLLDQQVDIFILFIKYCMGSIFSGTDLKVLVLFYEIVSNLWEIVFTVRIVT